MAKEQDPYGWMKLVVLVLRQGYGTVPTMELVFTTALMWKMLVYSAVQVGFCMQNYVGLYESHIHVFKKSVSAMISKHFTLNFFN